MVVSMKKVTCVGRVLTEEDPGEDSREATRDPRLSSIVSSRSGEREG